MRIAILSMQRVVNFGSVLQAWSLRRMIERITGEPVEFVDISETDVLPSCKKIREEMDYEQPAAYPPGICQKGKRWMITRLSAYNKRKIRAFMRNELQLDKPKADENYDWVVVGSDEVFNHARGLNLQLHGKIDQAERIISYAASCGSACFEDILPKDAGTVRAAMSRFQTISVRDKATEKYVASLYDGPLEKHLDPVLVGELGLQKRRPVPLKKYLLVYAYGQRIRTKEEITAIQRYAKARRLKTVAMGGSQFWCDLYVPASPMRLMDYFFHADAVVTDTFHGAVFSIINHRPFAVIMRKTNQNKLNGLLADLHLSDRKVEDPTRLEPVLDKVPDYEAVEMLLERERKKAYAYLNAQLGGKNGAEEASEN